jgi:hypothetical protein
MTELSKAKAVRRVLGVVVVVILTVVMALLGGLH